MTGGIKQRSNTQSGETEIGLCKAADNGTNVFCGL
jgi:hypothetical protein